MKKFLYILLALVMAPVALLVIITPMDSQKQYIFGLISIGLLFLMGISKKRSISGGVASHTDKVLRWRNSITGRFCRSAGS
jgi:hypothetical protein